MTNEQVEALLEHLDRIATALEGLSDLAIPRADFMNTELRDRPHLVDCLAMIADEMAKRP